MKKTQIGLMITAIVLFGAIFGFEKAEGTVRTPFLYLYSIAGKDHQSIYKGTATIVCEPNSRRGIRDEPDYIDKLLNQLRDALSILCINVNLEKKGHRFQ